MRNRVIIIALAAFVLGLAVATTAVLSAQQFTITTDTAGKILATSAPASKPPADLKLVVVGQRDGRIVGKLVANVDGKWVEVQLASQNMYVGR